MRRPSEGSVPRSASVVAEADVVAVLPVRRKADALPLPEHGTASRLRPWLEYHARIRASSGRGREASVGGRNFRRCPPGTPVDRGHRRPSRDCGCRAGANAGRVAPLMDSGDGGTWDALRAPLPRPFRVATRCVADLRLTASGVGLSRYTSGTSPDSAQGADPPTPKFPSARERVARNLFARNAMPKHVSPKTGGAEAGGDVRLTMHFPRRHDRGRVLLLLRFREWNP